MENTEKIQIEKIKKLIMFVRGYDEKQKTTKENTIEDYTQLQTYELKNEKLVKHTIKLNRLLSKKEKESIVNKHIVTDSQKHNLKEFQIDDFTKAYSCDDIEIVGKIDNKDGMFTVETSIKMNVDNIQEKTVEKTDRETKKKYQEKSFLFQTIISNGSSLNIIDVKVITDTLNKDEFLRKDALLTDVTESRINGKTYYKTTTIPTLV